MGINKIEIRSELWFTERYKGIYGNTFRIKKHIFSKKTKYAQLDIYESYHHGRLFVIDNAVQCDEKTEFFYHELLTHVPLFTHKNPKNILIVGGGDGGILREALKHNITNATMVEIDEEVITTCKKFFPIANGAFNDKRANIIIDDGIKFVKKHKNEFDVIITDLTDPHSLHSNPLYSKKFISYIYNSLKSDGLFSMQSGTPIYELDELNDFKNMIKQIFPIVRIYFVPISCYVGGYWPLIIGSKKYRPEDPRKTDFKGKCYSYEFHKASFKLPVILEKNFYK